MQRQLEGLEDARRRFIATASHELRTPIFSLGGFLELIQDEDLDDDTRRAFVGQVREQVDRLGKLATQLLDLSRLESGSVELEPAPTDLGVLARAVSSEFAPRARAARLAARAAPPARARARDLRPRARRPAAADPHRQRPDPHRRRHRRRRHGRRRRRERRRDAVGPRQRPGHPRGGARRASSSRSTAPTARAAPGSAWRSRTSWRCRWTRSSTSSRPRRHDLHAHARRRRRVSAAAAAGWLTRPRAPASIPPRCEIPSRLGGARRAGRRRERKR